MIMDRVTTMSIPTNTISKFNQCRLQKQLYFITDLLDSKQKGLHPSIFLPNYSRQNMEKFPAIEIPKSYWRIWENIVRTVQASVRVSGFYSGPVIRMSQVMWFQHESRTNLLSRIDKNRFLCFKLTSHSRIKYCYDTEISHELTLYDYVGYRRVQVQDNGDVLTTDGYDNQKTDTSMFAQKQYQPFDSI